MASHPTFIDLGTTPQGPVYTGLATPRGLPSPRLHVAGDRPPALSPLDAFAAQSRLLAKQLKENANRESRLPPMAISSALNQPRAGYFRSVSADEPTSFSSGISIKADIEVPENRPMSVHPTLSSVLKQDVTAYSHEVPLPPSPGILLPRFQAHDRERLRGRAPSTQPPDYGIRREQSPASIGRCSISHDNGRNSPETSYFPASSTAHSPRRHLGRVTAESARHISARPSNESMRHRSRSRLGEEQARRGSYENHALAPPRSPFAQHTPSIRSVSVASEDDLPQTLSTSLHSEGRKVSIGSATSSSPISPYVQPILRSPSISSEFSVGGSQLSRATFNFSRPLSRASEFAIDIPLRQVSSDGQPSIVHANDGSQTPVSLYGEEIPDTTNGVPTYLYSRFSLPRGKMLQRNSSTGHDGKDQTEAQWEQHAIGQSSSLQSIPVIEAPLSPASRPSTSSREHDSIDSASDSAAISAVLRDGTLPRSSMDRHPAPSVSSGSTIRAKSQHTASEETADFHVDKAIECHENGSLNESTYHLRIAARQNHPTGMLLYALACRHGWGMRPNQKEGVQWLRKAADFAILEVSEDDNQIKDGKAVNFMEQKTRKAQFALSIYELGVSHMNGWGIEQDKTLALRCFEIAGSWGDGDALAEAGFCYAQGVGCKKDLKKSAKFYRLAESKGISMVGNSWIYKKKYQDNDDEISLAPSPDKNRKDKSKPRTMFGRMKSST